MLGNIKITSQFWNYYRELVSKNVIPYQWKALNDQLPSAEPSHAIKNFRIVAGLEAGEYYGEVFQDSDVAKWIETVAYSLKEFPDQKLEEKVDELIDIIAMAQDSDGYLNTYYQLKAPKNKWKNLRDNHELYCAGHFIEAAVAYYKTTGKSKLLEVVEKFVELINQLFGTEEGKKRGYPGHEEIELALLKLYDVTKNPAHLNLAKYFIEVRGESPNYFEQEKIDRDGDDLTWNDDNNVNFGLGYEYQQAHKPVRQQQEVVGHAVRAVYYYTAIADLAKKTNDEELTKVVKRLWHDIVNSKMYITGGIGSSAIGESFTCSHDLPNDSMYCETCASIGLAFFADKMLYIEKNSEYGDIIEKLIYNGTISGMNLDGNRFFYVNPLEINQTQKYRKDQEHVLQERQKWLKTACCPPNLARFIASVERYIISENRECITTHQYISNNYQSATTDGLYLTQESSFPWSGIVAFKIQTKISTSKELSFRIPEWSGDYTIKINGEIKVAVPKKGYITLFEKWSDNDEIIIEFDCQPKLIFSNSKVEKNIGKVAIQKGPVVFCIEEVDNGTNLSRVFVDKLTNLKIIENESLNYGEMILFEGLKQVDKSSKLYHSDEIYFEEIQLTAVPYFLWGNRGYGEMKVWLNKYQ